METPSNTSATFTTIMFAMAVLFTVLKLAGEIDWSWWWVMAPLWIPVAAVVVGILLFLAGALVLDLVDKFRNSNEEEEQ